MKKLLFLLLVSIGLSDCVNAQITITNADMPNANDTFRVSLGTAPIGTNMSLTGANYTWDFSTLQWNTQEVDSFIPTSSTAALYALYFINSQFNPNRASIASRGDAVTAVPQLQITDIFNFYYESSSLFQQVGFGASLNGLTTPIAYGSKDVIYNFPLNFGNQDSSNSDYSIALTGLGAAIGSQKRVNNVDGWGTLITPFGTFNTVRVVATLTGEDSIYVDSLNFGITIPRPVTREYKWLANGERIPVLQINTTVIGANEVIGVVRYRDIYRSTSVGLDNVVANDFVATIHPNPSKSLASIVINSKSTQLINISIVDNQGKVVAKQQSWLASGTNSIALEGVESIANGSYLVLITGEKNISTLHWIKQ